MPIPNPTPTLQDGQNLAGAAYRLLTGRALPADLRKLQDYRTSNNRDMANAARFFLDLWGDTSSSAYDTLPSDVEPTNVVDITVHQTRHDLAHAFRSLDAARAYDPLDGKEPA